MSDEDNEEKYSDGRRKGTRTRKGGRKEFFREPFISKALAEHPSYDTYSKLLKRMTENPYIVVSRGVAFDFETGGSIIDFTDAGKELIYRLVREGKHHNSIARELGIHPQSLRNLRKRLPEIDALWLWAHGEEHDEIYALIREAAINGDPKMLTNNLAIMNSKFGWKQGEERVSGEKKESGQSQVNVQILNLPASFSRDQYNKMMENPEERDRYLKSLKEGEE